MVETYLRKVKPHIYKKKVVLEAMGLELEAWDEYWQQLSDFCMLIKIWKIMYTFQLKKINYSSYSVS